MAVDALLVDGAGRRATMALRASIPVYRVPIPQRIAFSQAGAMSLQPCHFQTADFEDVGQLPDGRVVYAQCGFGFQLWQAAVLFSTVQHRFITAAARELRQLVEGISTGPIFTLYDVTTPLSEQWCEREQWGVARPR